MTDDVIKNICGPFLDPRGGSPSLTHVVVLLLLLVDFFGPGNGSLTLTHLVVVVVVVVLVVLVVLVVIVVLVVLGLTLFEKSLRLLHFLFKFLQILSHNPL